jgi:hypothetical protein
MTRPTILQLLTHATLEEITDFPPPLEELLVFLHLGEIQIFPPPGENSSVFSILTTFAFHARTFESVTLSNRAMQKQVQAACRPQGEEKKELMTETGGLFRQGNTRNGRFSRSAQGRLE